MAFVISHPENGVFVGTALGLAFWTALDCAGQESVCAFRTEEDARDFLNETLAAEAAGGARIVETRTDRPYATAEDLLAAGLTDATKNLMTRKLANFDERGSVM